MNHDRMFFWKQILGRMTTKWAKERQGLGCDVLFIGYTGLRTFVDPRGELHNVLHKCREAKIMLANPFAENSGSRLDRFLHPGGRTGHHGRSAIRGIEYLKSMRKTHREIRLKLYPDAPFLRLLVLGDHIWVQYYQTGLEKRVKAEYLFKHDPDSASLYTPFYQYFWTRWNDPRLPEYDLDTDELIYRDPKRGEQKRRKVKFQFSQTHDGARPKKPAPVKNASYLAPRQLASMLFKALFPANGRQNP